MITERKRLRGDQGGAFLSKSPFASADDFAEMLENASGEVCFSAWRLSCVVERQSVTVSVMDW